MLSLLDPVQIDNLSLFRDDEDPRKFYVLPDEPAISVDAQGNPDFYFIHYIKDVAEAAATATTDDLGGGYMQFRSVLALSDDRRAKLVAALTARLVEDKQAGKQPFGNAITATDPLLANPLWTKGSAHLETFKVGDKELVRVATDTVPVDLAGDLGAAMTVTLSNDGAAVFWAAVKSPKDQQLPIVLRYDLSYQARVSADMTIHADRTTVINQIWQYAKPLPMRPSPNGWHSVPFDGEALTPAMLTKLQQGDPSVVALAKWVDVKAAIHSSISSGTIKVQIDIGEGAGGTDNKVQEMLFTLATDLLTNKVVPTIFGDPVADPGASATAPTDPNRVDASMLKMPPMDSSDTTKSGFDLTFTSTQVIEATCSPNAPVRLLIDDPAKLDACFKELRIADSFFSLMRVSASTSGVSFAQDGISRVHVYLAYDEIDEADPSKPRVQRSHDVELKSDSDTARWQFDTARAADGSHKRTYKFRSDVYYIDSRGTAAQVLSSPDAWITASDEMLEITPAHMGVVRVNLQFTARRDQVQGARVQLTATNRAGVELTDTFELSSDAPAKTWLRATGDFADAQIGTAPQPYTYQITYIVNGAEIALPAQPGTGDGIDLSGPFTRVLQYTILPQGSFDGVASISGTATYRDPTTGYRVVKTYQLTSLSASVALSVPALHDGPDTLQVTQTINHTDGSQTKLDDVVGAEGEVRVGLVVSRFLEVTVSAPLLDFDKDVQLAVVQLAYASSAAGDVSTTMTFSKAAHSDQVWKVPLRDGGSLAYDVDIQYIAYDRSKNSDVHAHPQPNASTRAVYLLDRAAK